MVSIRWTSASLVALWAVFLASFPASAAPAQKAGEGPPGEVVVATVGGEPITLRQLDQFIERLPENIRPAARARKRDILRSLIRRVLMYRFAREKKLETSERAKRQIARARREILIREAVLHVQESAEPTEEELKGEYEGNKEKYREGEKVTASHIMVASEEEARDLLVKLKEGAKFDELARKYSLAPERARGGSLGTMERGHHRLTGLPEVIETTAFSLEPGTYSGAVKSVYGWHVVYTSKVEEGRQLSFSEVRERIEKSLGEKKGEAALEKVLGDLEKQYPVKRFPDRIR